MKPKIRFYANEDLGWMLPEHMVEDITARQLAAILGVPRSTAGDLYKEPWRLEESHIDQMKRWFRGEVTTHVHETAAA